MKCHRMMRPSTVPHAVPSSRTGRRVVTSVLIFACGLLLGSCERDVQRASTQSGSASRPTDSVRPSEAVASPSPNTVPLGVHGADELVVAATAVIRFLRAEADFDRIRLADTVTLYLSPEGGGTRRAVPREMLRDRSRWMVRSRDLPRAPGMAYSLVPSAGRAELTTRVGRHLKCFDYPLSSIYAELAPLPHVGTMLAYGTGCLQTRNLTLVFDPNEKPPTLIAAVYDQWEW